MSGLLVSTLLLASLLALAVGVMLLQWRKGAISERMWLERCSHLEAQLHATSRSLSGLGRALSDPASGVGPCLARLADAALLIAEDREARADADARGLLEAVDWSLRRLQAKAQESHSLSPESAFPDLAGLSSERRERFAEAFATLRARHPFDEYDI